MGMLAGEGGGVKEGFYFFIFFNNMGETPAYL